MRAVPDPTRILVAGDVHGNSAWMHTLCDMAQQHGCDAILQLGDFGFWPKDPEVGRFIDGVSRDATRAGVTVYWIDGNHEDHAALRAIRPAADGFVDIGEHCQHIPRGLRWRWQSVRFGGLGGAFSIDWRDRTPGETWWPQEVTTEGDVEALGADRLDVLVTHEAPAGIPLAHYRLPVEDQVRTDEVRELVRDAIVATSPALVMHGHWHHRYSHELSWPLERDGQLDWGHTQVEGLAADVQGDGCAWGVLDLATLRFRGGEAVTH